MLYKKYKKPKKYQNGVQQVVVPPGATPSGGFGELVANNKAGSQRDALGATMDDSMNAMQATSSVALNPAVLGATGGLSALAIPAAGAITAGVQYNQNRSAEAKEGGAEKFNANAEIQAGREGQEVGFADQGVGNTYGKTMYGDMNPAAIYAENGITMGGESKNGVGEYNLTKNFEQAPTHEDGGLTYTAKIKGPVKSGSKNYTKTIEVEKGELEVTGKDGRVSIIPARKAKEAKAALKAGDNLRMENIIRSLPKEGTADPEGGPMKYEGGIQDLLSKHYDPSIYWGGAQLPTSPLDPGTAGQPMFQPFDPSANQLFPPTATAPDSTYMGQPISGSEEETLQAFLNDENVQEDIRLDGSPENLQRIVTSYNDFRGGEGQDPELNVDVLMNYMQSKDYDIGGRGWGVNDARNLGTDSAKAISSMFAIPPRETLGTSGIGTAASTRGINDFSYTNLQAPQAELYKPATLMPDIDAGGKDDPVEKTPGIVDGAEHPGWKKAGDVAGALAEAAPTIYNTAKGIFGKTKVEDPNYVDLPTQQYVDTLDPLRARTKGATNLAANTVYGANKSVQQQNAQMAKFRGSESLNAIDNEAVKAKAMVDAQNVNTKGREAVMNAQALEAAKHKTAMAEANKTQYTEAGIKGASRLANDHRTRAEAKSRDEISNKQQKQTLKMYEDFFPYMKRGGFE